MRQTPMSAMQARKKVSADSCTIGLHFIRKCIGLVVLGTPTDTGRKRLGGHSAPVGGGDKEAEKCRVIFSIQIVPMDFRGKFEK
jgi:hypothetical protein